MKTLFIGFLMSAVAVQGFTPHDRALSAPEPNPIVILVHGRGQSGMDTAWMRRDWKRQLDTALVSVGSAPMRDADVRLAWYADALDPNAENDCVAPATRLDEMGLGDITRVLFASLADALPTDESRPARAFFGELLWFVDDAMRCSAGRRFGAVLQAAAAESRPIVVVAYSMGALVAYDYLQRHALHGADIRLITAGSPLGARDFHEILLGVNAKLSVPGSVTSWTNVYDPDDPVAAPVGIPSVSDLRTETPYGGSAHYQGRYLRDPAMGRALARAMAARGER